MKFQTFVIVALTPLKYSIYLILKVFRILSFKIICIFNNSKHNLLITFKYLPLFVIHIHDILFLIVSQNLN